MFHRVCMDLDISREDKPASENDEVMCGVLDLLTAIEQKVQQLPKRKSFVGHLIIILMAISLCCNAVFGYMLLNAGTSNHLNVPPEQLTQLLEQTKICMQKPVFQYSMCTCPDLEQIRKQSETLHHTKPDWYETPISTPPTETNHFEDVGKGIGWWTLRSFGDRAFYWTAVSIGGPAGEAVALGIGAATTLLVNPDMWSQLSNQTIVQDWKSLLHEDSMWY